MKLPEKEPFYLHFLFLFMGLPSRSDSQKVSIVLLVDVFVLVELLKQTRHPGSEEPLRFVTKSEQAPDFSPPFLKKNQFDITVQMVGNVAGLIKEEQILHFDLRHKA